MRKATCVVDGAAVTSRYVQVRGPEERPDLALNLTAQGSIYKQAEYLFISELRC